MRDERVFSLIELLIIIAIMSTLTAIAILGTEGIRTGYRVRGATRLVYGDMQMARLIALKEGKEMAVEFITGTPTTYCIKQKATPGGDWDAGCDIGGNDTLDVIRKTVDLSSDYSGVTVNPTNLGNSIETANERAEFNPNGTASSGSMTLSKDTRIQIICFTTGTGRVRIVDGTCS